MPFEDLLVPKRRCATCAFIEELPKPEQDEVNVAMAKAKWSDKALTDALSQITKFEGHNPPGLGSVRSHRVAGHNR